MVNVRCAASLVLRLDTAMHAVCICMYLCTLAQNTAKHMLLLGRHLVCLSCAFCVKPAVCIVPKKQTHVRVMGYAQLAFDLIVVASTCPTVSWQCNMLPNMLHNTLALEPIWNPAPLFVHGAVCCDMPGALATCQCVAVLAQSLKRR
jgi:hypothetical protein